MTPEATDLGRHRRMLQGLALSLALHVAVLSLWQVEMGSHETRTLVIQSRLVMPANNRTDHLIPPESPSREPTRTEPAPEARLPQTPSPPVLALPEPVLPTPATTAAAVLAPANHPLAAASPAPAQTAKSAGPPMGAPMPSPMPSLPLAVDAAWYPTRKVDVPARVISGGEPEYPKMAKMRNQEGWVVIQVRINKLGRAEEAKVLEASPPGVFDDAAVLFYRIARYEPAIKEGRTVNFETRFKVNFTLEDEK
ncbi:MAG: energy transducer TonB [Betaproteobacteria bacterium]|nr:energy transducer TonB [Betaproteobacteria bacterium]